MDPSYAKSASPAPIKSARPRLDIGDVPWLLTASNVECWFFRQDVPGYASSHYTVTWQLADAANVSEGRQEYWINVAQRAVLQYGSGTRTKRRVTSTIGFARNVRSFVQWVCCTRYCESLAAVSKDDVIAYERYIEGLDVTQSTAEQRLIAVRTLGQCSDVHGRTMSWRPYRYRGDLRRVVKRVGRADGRTRTLDPEAFFALLDYCLLLIEDSDGVVERADVYLNLRDSPRRTPWPEVLGERSAKQIITEARLTYGACIVLAFSLLGSRKHQLALLDVCDVPGQTGSENSILVGRVSKTSNGPGGTETAQPAIAELERALAVVVSLTGVDLNEGSGPLFRCLKLDEGLHSRAGRALETNHVYNLITNVAKAAGIKIVVRPHMFRRAFSMLYVWRYELGDLQHLSRFLHHNSLRHTLAYAQGDDISVFIGDAQRELAKSIMERAMTGNEAIGGSLSALLKRLANRLRAQTSLLRPDQIDDWIEARLADGQFTLKAAPHGYCLIFGSRARRSKCSTDGRTPDYGNRTDEHCSACGNFVLTERSRQYWEERVSAHEQVAKTTRLAAVKKVAEGAISAARRVLSTLAR